MKLTTDKIGHFTVGFVLYCLCYILVQHYAILFVAVVAALKEYRDGRGKGTPEVLDFLATLLGGIAASLILS